MEVNHENDVSSTCGQKNDPRLGILGSSSLTFGLFNALLKGVESLAASAPRMSEVEVGGGTVAPGTTRTLGFLDARAEQGFAILSPSEMFLLQDAVNTTKVLIKFSVHALYLEYFL